MFDAVRTDRIRRCAEKAIRNLEARTGKTWAQICEPWLQAQYEGR